eukprot:Sspe_Gene.96365::Locus_69029_Transcript_1_1_Confidence_1.000_Length_690::g.96365::m.96365
MSPTLVVVLLSLVLTASAHSASNFNFPQYFSKAWEVTKIDGGSADHETVFTVVANKSNIYDGMVVGSIQGDSEGFTIVVEEQGGAILMSFLPTQDVTAEESEDEHSEYTDPLLSMRLAFEELSPQVTAAQGKFFGRSEGHFTLSCMKHQFVLSLFHPNKATEVWIAHEVREDALSPWVTNSPLLIVGGLFVVLKVLNLVL